jgi:hypothetical protein
MEKSPPHQMVIPFEIRHGYQSVLTIIALENPWYMVTAVSFMAANMSEAVHCCTNMSRENLSTRKNQFNAPAPEANLEKLLSTRKVRNAGPA